MKTTEKARHIATPAPGTINREAAIEDGSVWALVLTNLAVLALALYFGWSLAEMVAVYWTQSVIIGLSYFIRILSLERFSTENFKMNDRAVDPTPATKRQVALFFLAHFGIFHLVYAGFVWSGEFGQPPPLNREFWLFVAAFAVNHYYSFRYHRERDSKGTPNIGTLMFTPYVRVLPMHFIIIFGAFLPVENLGLLIFGLLKTIADAVMHQIEHQKLQMP